MITVVIRRSLAEDQQQHSKQKVIPPCTTVLMRSKSHQDINPAMLVNPQKNYPIMLNVEPRKDPIHQKPIIERIGIILEKITNKQLIFHGTHLMHN